MGRIITFDYSDAPTLKCFSNSRAQTRVLMGPFGCVRGDSLVITEEGPLPIASLNRPVRVLSWDEKSSRFVFSLIGGAFPKGKDYLYRVSTQQGEFVAAGHHRVLSSGNKYLRVDELCLDDSLVRCSSVHSLKFLSECQTVFPLGEESFYQRCQDLMGHYAELARQYGERLLSEVSNVQVSLLAPTCAQISTCRSFVPSSVREDGYSGRSQEHTHRDLPGVRKQTDDYCREVAPRNVNVEDQTLSRSFSRILEKVQQSSLHLLKTAYRQIGKLRDSLFGSSVSSLSEWPIVAIEKLKVKETFWDMQVLDTNNYVTADGTIHHNSGKSSACVMEILQVGAEQAPNDDGVRKTRWAVVRNTYRQLTDTTIKTFMDWVPQGDCGTFKISTHDYLIDKIPGPDGTKMEIEVLFRALDRPDHVRNLLSMELTAAWFNEVREIPRMIFDAMDGRVGRFPSMKDGGPTWHGIIADTNPCDTDHWLYKLFFEQLPNDIDMQGKYEFYKQPGGRSPEAENLKHLRPGYYHKMCIGKSPEFIKVYADGEFGYVRDGKPVYPNYSDTMHLAAEPLEPRRGVPLILAFDFGLTPAVVFAQQLANGQFLCLRELCGKDIGLKRFVTDVVRPFLFANFHGLQIVATGDPAGIRRNDDESTAYMILKDLGIHAKPAMTNSFVARYNAVDGLLMKLSGGKGAFQLDSRCVMLHKGFLGEYKFRRIRVSHDDKFVDQPDKNDYSHPHDALQYAAMIAESGMQQVRNIWGGGSTAERSYEPPMSAWM